MRVPGSPVQGRARPKEVIAVAGDVVRLDSAGVAVNGRPLPAAVAWTPMRPDSRSPAFPMV